MHEGSTDAVSHLRCASNVVPVVAASDAMFGYKSPDAAYGLGDVMYWYQLYPVTLSRIRGVC